MIIIYILAGIGALCLLCSIALVCMIFTAAKEGDDGDGEDRTD